MKKLFVLLLALCCVAPLETKAQNETTKVVVRALAKDAKFIGSSMGGAYVTIREVKTGELLAQGITEGSTGDTDKLVRQPRQRYSQISTKGAAKFEADIALDEPVFVEVAATAPGAQKQSQVRSSTQLWLIPGKDITGDGIILEVPGFAIDILQPQAHEVTNSNTITIAANAVMMCGCPTSPNGLWDSGEMEFRAVVSKDGEQVATKQMEFSGKTSTFEASFEPSEPGAYEITVWGYDQRTGNTGVDKTSVVISN